MNKVIVIGGGVIGLSIAYELTRRKHQVMLLERDALGRQSSWAGAGILPPVNGETAIHPMETLEALSSELHWQWSQRLLKETGIDNQLQASGGLYLARTTGEQAALSGLKLYWRERAIPFEAWDDNRLSAVTDLKTNGIRDAIFAPGEFQLRNPRHLQSLELACRKLGVEILQHQGKVQIEVSDGQVTRVVTKQGSWTADVYCIACGAWSEEVFRPFGLVLPTTPVRGQVALFSLTQPWQVPIINEGTRYLVPRQDGQVLAGATIEEVGFNSSTDPRDIAELVSWAHSLNSNCNPQTLIQSWAGLRPGSNDGMPYLGKVGDNSNTIVATGHFKSGLHLSTGTAVVVADLIDGISPRLDLSPFSISRGLIGASTGE